MSEDRNKSDNQEREDRILEAASRLIVHYGYDKTTVSDIAREAAVSKGAIYLHFDSKEDLFESLLRREVLSYSAHWLELMEADPRGGTPGGIYRATLHAMQGSDLLMALFRRDRRILGSFTTKNQTMGNLRTKSAVSTEILQQMQSVGAMRDDVDASAVGYIMSMLAFGLVSMDDIIPPEEQPDIETVINTIAIIFDRALSPPDETGQAAASAFLKQMVETARAQIAQQNTTTDESD